MENSYLPNVPEKNPAPPARQSTVCGADLIYISICSGGTIIKIRAAERANFRTTHYRRRNVRFNFGRTDTLVDRLKMLAWWSGRAHHACAEPLDTGEEPAPICGRLRHILSLR
jgi:hypothetical protein